MTELELTQVLALKHSEIWDTAIKIGLGAIIAGVISLGTTLIIQHSQSKREKHSRQQEYLHKFFTTWHNYRSSMYQAYAFIWATHHTTKNHLDSEAVQRHEEAAAELSNLRRKYDECYALAGTLHAKSLTQALNEARKAHDNLRQSSLEMRKIRDSANNSDNIDRTQPVNTSNLTNGFKQLEEAYLQCDKAAYKLSKKYL